MFSFLKYCAPRIDSSSAFRRHDLKRRQTATAQLWARICAVQLILVMRVLSDVSISFLNVCSGVRREERQAEGVARVRSHTAAPLYSDGLLWVARRSTRASVRSPSLSAWWLAAKRRAHACLGGFDFGLLEHKDAAHVVEVGGSLELGQACTKPTRTHNAACYSPARDERGGARWLY